jgi:hypothetical protein
MVFDPSLWFRSVWNWLPETERTWCFASPRRFALDFPRTEQNGLKALPGECGEQNRAVRPGFGDGFGNKSFVLP